MRYGPIMATAGPLKVYDAEDENGMLDSVTFPGAIASRLPRSGFDVG